MKASIYLPDDLRQRVKAVGGINVSAVCQAALDAEVRRRQALAHLDDGMEPVVVRTAYGPVTFVGRLLFAGVWIDDEVRTWLTRRHRLAVHWASDAGGVLDDFDDLDALAAEWGGLMPAMVSAVADALGRRHALELDI